MKKTYLIQEMHCASCAKRIEDVVRKIPEIKSASVNFATKKAYVESDKEVNFNELQKTVSSSGDYKLIDEGEKEKQVLFLL